MRPAPPRERASVSVIESEIGHYTFRAEWSPERGEYAGFCLEIPALLCQYAPTAPQAIAAIEAVVRENVECMISQGEKPPASFAERKYSGTIVIRTSSDLHRRLAIEAVEERVSLNQWVVQKLADRRQASLDW